MGAPGLALGSVVETLARRGRRVAGGLIGAVAGFVAWLLGWLRLMDAL